MNIPKKLIIAIDGHSSSGKSTVAKELAKLLGYIYVDSGAMYRAVTFLYLRNHPEIIKIEANKIDLSVLQPMLNEIDITFKYNGITGKQETYLNNESIEKEIRGIVVSENVSPISTIKMVREKLVALQQKLGENGGIVMDGRDIGTVVFPNADMKLFMTASVEARALRRYQELLAKGETVSFDEIRNNLQNRDHIDSSREESPLRKAADAISLDNSGLTHDQQMKWVTDKLKQLFPDIEINPS